MKTAIVLVSLLVALPALADDVADVNAAADRFATAFNENSSSAVALLAADGVLAYFEPVPVLQGGKDALKAFLQAQFDFTETVQVVPTGPRTTNVTGTTGVVAQPVAYLWKPIDGASESMFVNQITVWSKVEGEWLLTAMMTNALPHGTTP